MSTILAVIIAATSGVFVAIINMVYDLSKTKAARREEAQNRAAERADQVRMINEALETFKASETTKNREIDQRLDRLEDEMGSQSEALRLLMLDRITHIGNGYLAAGNVTVKEKALLKSMRDCYHEGLGGNGDADAIWEAVAGLPYRVED